MSKLENEEIRKWENGVRATRKVPAEGINFAKIWNFGKVYTAKKRKSSEEG